MILKTDVIQKFLSDSSVVRPNVLHPTLSNLIKVEYTSNNFCFSKTNYNIFCSFTFPDKGFHIDDEAYLISESSLNSIAQTTNSETITISEKDGHILITGGKKEVVKYPKRPLTDFPDMPVVSGETYALPIEILRHIKIAGNYISKEQKITVAGFVQVGSDGIFSTNNNNMVYCNSIKSELPKIFFGEDALQVIKSVDDITYATHGNMDFIKYGSGLSYGIIRPTIENGINYLPMIGAVAIPSFTIEREKILEFCTRVKYVAKSEYPTAVMEYDGIGVDLKYVDAGFNIEASGYYECCENFSVTLPFRFSVTWFDTFLKHLPYKKLTFSRMGNHFKITSPDDENYTGIYAGIF